jgi:hypothetical protein
VLSFPMVLYLRHLVFNGYQWWLKTRYSATPTILDISLSIYAIPPASSHPWGTPNACTLYTFFILTTFVPTTPTAICIILYICTFIITNPNLDRIQSYARLDTDLTCRDRRHNLLYNKTAIQVDHNGQDPRRPDLTIHVIDTHHHGYC